MIGAVSESKNLAPKVGKVFIVAKLPGPMVAKEFQLLVKHKLSKLNGQEKTWEQR
ncbi:MAG: hypothetical protein ABSG02_15150 [Terriglobales bacterium]|jgi:hypothetical protein